MPVAEKPPKKAFRWADEAGEGNMEDTEPRSALAQQAKASEAGAAESDVFDDADATRTRAAALKDGEEPGSAGAEWEDVAAGGAPKRAVGGGSMFDRNFLAKRAAANSSFGALNKGVADEVGSTRGSSPPIAGLGVAARTRTMSTPAAPLTAAARAAASRAPFAELAQSRAGTSGSAPSESRASPYKRRESALGPVRRRGRSSLNLSDAVKVSSSPLRLASGPPGHTAARAAAVDGARSSSGGSKPTFPSAARTSIKTRSSSTSYAPAARINVTSRS